MSRSAKLPANVLSESTEQDYVKWLNRHLAKATPPIVINGLTEDNICNGVAIGLLLESIGDVKFNGLLLQPGTRVERLHNVHEVFSVLRRLNVRLESVQPEDVINGSREAILQLLLSISSYFMLHPRARKQVNLDAEVRNFKSRIGASPSSSLRQTPSERFTPQSQGAPSGVPSAEPTSLGATSASGDNEEYFRPTYTHEIIGPTVHPGGQSGNSSPRSRSSMTFMYSGQRSPTAQKANRPVTRNEYPTQEPIQVTQTQAVKSQLKVVKDGVVENGRPDYSHGVQSKPRTDTANSHGFNPINELSSLRNKLHDISRLITDDSGRNAGVNTSTVYSERAVQTDGANQLERELKLAKQKIIELKVAYEKATEELLKTRAENEKLTSALRNLQDAVRRSGSPSRDQPAGFEPWQAPVTAQQTPGWDNSHYSPAVETKTVGDARTRRMSPHDPRSYRSPTGNRYDAAEKLRDQFQPFVEQLANMRRARKA